MKIYCTKEEFRKMSANCSKSDYCGNCVFENICETNYFIDFVEEVDCSNEKETEVQANVKVSEY